MIPLDNFAKWTKQLDEYARLYLTDIENQEYLSIPDPERLEQLKDILEKPIARFTPVNEVFFRGKWAEAIRVVHSGNELSLLEVATGDADMIPQMLARTRSGSRYITANMNRILTNRLRERTSRLPIEMMVIEEDAAKINRYLAPESIDIIAFQHAVNDVIQAILCEREGVDTIDTDWMETLPKMIHTLQSEIKLGTLEQHAKPAFLMLLENLSKVLKPGGVMVMSHYMFQLDLDWGYPPGLWENFIPITREWVKALSGCKEIFINNFEPHWWMFLRKE